MPLVGYNLTMVRMALDSLRSRPETSSRRLSVGSFSCPDIIFPDARLADLFNLNPAILKRRADSKEITNWHQTHAIVDPQGVVDTVDFFDKLNCDFTAYDLTVARGCETVADLCRPLPESEYLRHDILFDCISHQAFDTPAVWRNALYCTRERGFIIHSLPAVMVGHGFWDVSPLTFRSFYEANGARVVYQRLVEGVYSIKAEYDPVPVGRRAGLPDKTMNVVLVSKESTVPYCPPVHPKFLL